MLSRVASAGARGALRARLPVASSGGARARALPLIQPAFQSFHAGECCAVRSRRQRSRSWSCILLSWLWGEGGNQVLSGWYTCEVGQKGSCCYEDHVDGESREDAK